VTLEFDNYIRGEVGGFEDGLHSAADFDLALVRQLLVNGHYLEGQIDIL